MAQSGSEQSHKRTIPQLNLLLNVAISPSLSLAFDVRLMLEPMFFRDARYAFRVLLSTPGFTAIAVISLALGIGANSAIFSLADALVLRPLPVPNPSQVVTVSDTAPDLPVGTLGRVSYPDYLDLRDKTKSFSGLVAVRYSLVGMSEQRDALPELRLAVAVSGNFFNVLGVQPTLGRRFSAEEDRVSGRDAVAVLGYDAWEHHFAADPKVAGRAIRLNNVEFKIIGVTPKKFTGLDPLVHPDLYIPVTMLPRISSAGMQEANLLDRRDLRSFTVKGRLARGIGLAQANADVDVIAANLAAAYPATNKDHRFMARTEIQARAAQSGPNVVLSVMLLAIAGLVLIIACANVANLLLSRARSRAREMAVRLAIGATRPRLLRQLLTENLILSLAGAALGLLLAQVGAEYFASFHFSSDLPLALEARVDQRVLFFSLIAAVLSALMFGLAPAIRSAKTDLVPALKTGDSNGGHRRTLGRNALVIGQVALSLMLLCAATLFIRTLRAVIMANPGFRTDHLLMMSFDPTLVRYTPDQTREFYRTVLERARQLPGAQDAALSETIPFDGTIVAVEKIAPERYQFPQGKQSEPVLCNTVDGRYFETMGMPVVRGRAIRSTDAAAAPRVAVVNEAMANRFWPNQDPIGKRFRLADRNSEWVQVVGVSKNSVYLVVGEPRLAFFYLPLAQNPQPRMTLLVETGGDAAGLAEPLRNMVRSIDAHQPVYNVRTMSEYYRTQGLQALRAVANMVGIMGLLGLSMALVGLYGLVAYSVSRRTREIGIRMAIGAENGDILRIVLRQGMTLAVIGVAVGLAGSFGVVRGIRAMFSRLLETNIFDPWTFIAVPAAMLAVTLLASYIPARRAAAIDPNQALHYE